MNDSGWERLLDALDIQVGLRHHGKATRPLEDKPELMAQVTYVEFTAAGSDYKLERVVGPAIVERKTHFTKTAGGDVRHENIYHDTETAAKVFLYKKDGDDWVETPIDSLRLS